MATTIHKGKSSSGSDIVYSFDGKSIFKGRSSSGIDILFTFDGKHIYKGRSTSGSDILYTFDGKHVYKGRSTSGRYTPLMGNLCIEDVPLAEATHFTQSKLVYQSGCWQYCFNIDVRNSIKCNPVDFILSLPKQH